MVAVCRDTRLSPLPPVTGSSGAVDLFSGDHASGSPLLGALRERSTGPLGLRVPPGWAQGTGARTGGRSGRNGASRPDPAAALPSALQRPTGPVPSPDRATAAAAAVAKQRTRRPGRVGALSRLGCLPPPSLACQALGARAGKLGRVGRARPGRGRKKGGGLTVRGLAVRGHSGGSFSENFPGEDRALRGQGIGSFRLTSGPSSNAKVSIPDRVQHLIGRFRKPPGPAR